MTRVAVLAAAVLLVVATLPAGPAAADGFVAVSTTVTPEQPTVEESFTIEAAVSNAADSDTTYRITELAVTETADAGSEELATAEPSQRIGSDETVRTGIDVTINETGEQTVYLQVTLLTDGGDERTVTQPVTVNVREPHPQVGVSAESAAPGESRPLTVTLSNGLGAELSNVELRVAGENVSIRNDRRVAARVGAGADRAFEFSVTPDAETRQPVTVELQYTVDGERRTLERELQADFSTTNGSSDRPHLQLGVQEAVPGAQRSVNVTVANGLTEDLRQLRVLVETNNETLSFAASERVQAALAAGETATFRFPATAETAGRLPVTVTLVYTDDGTRKRVSQTFTGDFTGPDSPGTVRLTNVQAVLMDGQLRIDATAGNPGTTDIGGVTVAVGDSDAVGDADFFLGTIEAADGFQSFTLTAPAAGNVSSVPVEVSYVIDGVRERYTTELSVAQPATPAPASDGGGGPGLLLPAVGVLAVVALVGLLVRRRR